MQGIEENNFELLSVKWRCLDCGTENEETTMPHVEPYMCSECKSMYLIPDDLQYIPFHLHGGAVGIPDRDGLFSVAHQKRFIETVDNNPDWLDMGIVPTPKSGVGWFFHHLFHGLMMGFPFWEIIKFSYSEAVEQTRAADGSRSSANNKVSEIKYDEVGE